MVFNWFRRQFGTNDGSSEETSSENPPVEQEQTASEPSDVEVAPAVAEDYLSFAKAAYKNLQKRQLSEDVAATATESPEIEQEESVASSAETTAVPEVAVATKEDVKQPVALIDTATTIESKEEATPEIPAVEETPLAATDVAEPQEQARPETTEAASEEDSAPVEAAVARSEVEARAEAVEPTPAPERDALPETLADTTSADAQEEAVPEVETLSELPAAVEAITPETETVTPVLEAPSVVEAESAVAPATGEAESASTAPVPIWARSADRQARLERLKATAIETPEPEPARASVPPVQPAATTTVEVEEVPGLAFDEGFLWSTEVLAAQGRRPEDVSIEEISWLKRLRQGLDKTRRSLINQLKAIVGQGPLNQDAVTEIEALLLQADVGVEATDYIINTLQQKLREEVLPPEEAIAYLKTILRDLLDRPCQESYNPTFVPEKDTLNIWLMTGVNGAGKTTTIGKLAHLASKSGYRCLIGAADTFRAAAVEQVKAWGERSGTEVIANPGKNTDPAAVVFDAIAAAQSRNVELLLVDTAGRLQNKKNLMEELAKIRRIVDKKAPDAKVEALLVLDATLGQNGLRQAEVFSQAAKLSGVVLTKLDGTAKGGVALAVVQQLGLPIRFIGAGEGIEDLRPFSSYEFVEALLSG
ncbi:MAG: signal recognition particle-docking protein FtsY [Cyanobacteriota bacterium]|nr:signal recognition particle-docking protein FtsY [Cyanobacteriota bacterium]